MELNEILPLFAAHPQVKALAHLLETGKARSIFCEGLRSSAAPLSFAALPMQDATNLTCLFIMNDEEEAGYFYHDLAQLLGDTDVLFFPSGYRRAARFAQRDAANDILRTAVLSRLADRDGKQTTEAAGQDRKSVV